MKKSMILLASIFMAFSILSFSGCNNEPSPDDSGTPNNTQSPDEILGKTYKVDISGLSPWQESDTFKFDKTSGKLTISELSQGGGLYFSPFDASDYNYLEIKYRLAKGSFSVMIEYSDKTTNMVGCPEYDNVAYITLNPEKKDNLSSITVQSHSYDVSVIIESITFTEKKPEISAIVDKQNGNFDSSISAIDFAKKMGIGWNLAEALEAHSGDWSNNPQEIGLASETCFTPDQPYTTKEIIQLPKDSGYSSIRIPTTWYNHIIDDNYTIDPKWMARVKQVVDWAIDAGYYVILNEHHSVREKLSNPIKYGEGYIVRNTPEDIAESERFLKAIWTQIATTFNGSYDEHLIFEFMNEPRNVGHDHEWNPGLVKSYFDYSTCKECIADYKILNEYNQLCLDTIRATGGNNSKRFLIIPSLCEQEGTLLHELFKLPADNTKDKLMVTTHNYIMGVKDEYIKNEFTSEIESELIDLYSNLNNTYVKKGIPVIVGETHTLRNIPYAQREKWAKTFYKIASGYGMPVLYWEGVYEKSNHFDRENLKVIEPEFVKLMIDTWIEGSEQPVIDDNDDSYKLDLSQLVLWDKTRDIFNFTTGKLTLKDGWGGGDIWLGNYTGEYNYLEIKYKDATAHFVIVVEYEDETVSKTYCKINSTEAYIKLEPKKVKNIKIQKSHSEKMSVILEDFSFVQEKTLLDNTKKEPIVDKKTGSFDSSISAITFTKQMKVGWNLAGILEADIQLGRFNAENPDSLEFVRSLGTETEFCWGNKPYTTKEIINFPKNNGYSSIRIPVTWYNHIIDDNYTIDPEWMARVKEIVDWSIEAGYYVILNSHHDVGEWIISPLRKTNGYVIKNDAADIDESKKFLKAIWSQIATAFNGSYDEHLIFETLNEPRNVQHDHQWYANYCAYSCAECKADYEILNEYNQLCLNTIRASGNNNANRFVMVPALATGDATPLIDLFKMPEDSAEDKLILTVHNYIMGCEPNDSKEIFSSEMKKSLTDTFSQLNTKFVEKGIPVVIGETSANRLLISKSERINWITYFSKLASSYGMPLLYWDIPEDAGYSLDQFDRKNLKFIEPDFVQAMLDNWECK